MATASSIMDRARRIIQDETSVRWPLAELCLWINDGLRELRTCKPELFSVPVVIGMAAGVRQCIPDEYERVLRFTSNAQTYGSDRRPRRAITMVDKSLLDVTVPGWTDERRPKPQVVHVMVDEAEPRAFYVWPANDGNGAINAAVVLPHTPIAATGDVALLASYDTELPVPDHYANALVDYVLSRSYSKDAQFSANQQLAIAYFSKFAGAVGIEVAQDAASTPNAKPGLPRASTGVSMGGAANA